MFEAVWQDLKYAARALRRAPGFTVAAVLTLALGIGATSAIFTVMNAALLKPLPYPDPDRLLVLGPEVFAGSQTGQLFLYLRDRLRTFDHIAAQRGSNGWNVVVPRQGSRTSDFVSHAKALRVSDAYFAAHGVQPLLGRGFSRAEDQPNSANVVVISEELWERAFDRRAEALGQTIQLGGVPHAVVGIAPRWFRSIPQAEVWTPLRITPTDNTSSYEIVARLRDTATAADAAAELDGLRADIQREFPRTNPRRVAATRWVSLRQFLGGNVRQPLLLLLGAVGFLLLIACVNIAGLQMTRTLGRRREMATRAAIGGSRAQLVRQVLAESALLAAVGAVAGLAVAAGSTQLILSLVSEPTARDMLSGEVPGVDWRVLGFTTGVALLSGLLFGVLPASAAARVDLRAAMSGSTRITASRRAMWLRRSLAAAEVALACVLLVGAGLLLQTLFHLNRAELGFTPTGVMLGRMSLQGAIDATEFESFLARGLDRVRDIPGVVGAAASSGVPVERGSNVPLDPPAGGQIGEPRAVDWRYVTPEYFDVFEIPVLVGRRFDERDRIGAAPVAIVNEAFARVYFGRVDVVGETIGLAPAFKDAPRQIVGVVGNVKARTNTNWTEGLTALGSGAPPTMFVPAGGAAMIPQGRGAQRVLEVTWSVRADGARAGIEREVQEALRTIDSRAAFIAFEPMDAVIARDLDIPRFVSSLLAAFAALAMVLAAIGLYGLMAYAGSQRRREVGIRMAFGATAGRVLRRFMAEGLLVACIGLAGGIVCAVLVTNVLQALLFGVTPLDLSTFAAAAGLLLAVTAVATAVPAARAARVDPVIALKTD